MKRINNLISAVLLCSGVGFHLCLYACFPASAGGLFVYLTAPLLVVFCLLLLFLYRNKITQRIRAIKKVYLTFGLFASMSLGYIMFPTESGESPLELINYTYQLLHHTEEVKLSDVFMEMNQPVHLGLLRKNAALKKYSFDLPPNNSTYYDIWTNKSDRTAAVYFKDGKVYSTESFLSSKQSDANKIELIFNTGRETLIFQVSKQGNFSKQDGFEQKPYDSELLKTYDSTILHIQPRKIEPYLEYPIHRYIYEHMPIKKL